MFVFLPNVNTTKHAADMIVILDNQLYAGWIIESVQIKLSSNREEFLLCRSGTLGEILCYLYGTVGTKPL